MAKKPKPTPATAAPDGDREIPEGESSAVTELLGRIDRAKTLVNKFNTETLPMLRRYSYGTKHGEEGNAGSTTRTNMIFATQATLLPHIYAKNPEISVAPSEAAGEDEYESIKDFCSTAQVMQNRVFVEDGKLKKRAKSNVRSAMNTGVGWIKMTFQKSLVGDPIILRRANDLQDNIRKLEFLASKAKIDTDPQQLARERDEMQQQYDAIMAGTEIKMFKGFALDRVQSEDILILDESIVDFDDYAHAKAIAHRVWMTDEEYHETFGHKPYSGTTQFGQPSSTEHKDEGGSPIPFSDHAKQKYRCVWEVWDKTTSSVKTVAEGSKGYCREPYIPKKTPERWYPFYCLAFNMVEGRWRPLSDVELLYQLQDEYNTTRFLFAETRKEAIPNTFFRKGGNLTEEDVKKIVNRKAREFIGIEGNPGKPISDDILRLDVPNIDPAAFDVTMIRNDMDMMVGLSDASRSNLIEAKTATEAEIMRQSLMTRVAERQDANEDLITEMAQAGLQIMLQEFTLDEVKELAGPEAVWPKLSVEEIFTKVNVSVRAGSTGKPNVKQEREQWAAIMPIIKDTMAQVAELRTAGQFDMADALVELLKETFKRYDERIDVDRFIPRTEMGDDGVPVQQANAIAEAVQIKEQAQKQAEELQKAQEQILKLEQALTIAKQNDATTAAKTEADAVIVNAQESAKAAEANAKVVTADADAAAKYAADIEKANIAANNAKQMNKDKLEAEERMEKLRLESQERIAKITAGAKIATAKKKGDASASPEGGEPAEDTGPDNEYNAIVEILGKQAESMSGQTEELTKLAEAVAQLTAGRDLTVTTPEGRILKGTSTPRKLNS